MSRSRVPHRLSALLSFTAENVRSYRDEVHISFLGTRLAEKGTVRRLAVRGAARPCPVLPVAGVFGANASGKSTLLKAMSDMRTVVLSSYRQGSRGTPIHRRPFLLDGECMRRPSGFGVELILEGVRWQYGFRIDSERVLEEYAYHFPHGRPARVFHRTNDEIEFGPPFRSAGRHLLRLLRSNALLLSLAGAAEDEHLGRLFAWFMRNLMLAESGNRGMRAARTADLAHSADKRRLVLGMLQAADLGVTNAERASPDPEVAERIKKAVHVLSGVEDDQDLEGQIIIEDPVRLTHAGPGGDVGIDPGEESEGTKVWVGLIGPVVDVLNQGGVLLADELDTSLHPHLVKRLVGLFQDTHTNPRCAQLVFNAHDTTLLGDSERRVIGRDQIWFTEKGADGVTSLYPLADLGPRQDEALERRYLQGRYGGVPFLNPADVHRWGDWFGVGPEGPAASEPADHSPAHIKQAVATIRA